MVLESQMARSGGERRYMTSRQKSGMKLPAVIVVLAAIAGVCYWIISASGGTSGNDGPNNATPSQARAGMGGANADNRAEESATATTDPADPDEAPSSRTPARDRSTEDTPPPPPPQTRETAAAATDGQTPPADNTQTAPTELRKIAQARALIDADRFVDARELLNDALKKPLGPEEAHAVRQLLGQVNAKLIFSPYVDKDDPFSRHYVIKPGEFLGKIAPRHDVPWRFIARINNITDARRIRAGQRLKIIDGPFHAVVDKSDFRLELYLQANGDPHALFIRSFTVGLGAHDSTPLGKFIVKRGSKLTNPEWTNPRTGQVFHPEDPRNPIGERWIGLRGADENTQRMSGYGIHGTIDPDSIGQQASMGCIRMRPDAVALVYDLLKQEKSTVIIKP